MTLENMINRLDDSLKTIPDLLPPDYTAGIHRENLGTLRQIFIDGAREMRKQTPAPEGVTLEVVSIPAHDGVEIELRIARPDKAAGDSIPAILWVHGGGFILGSAEYDDLTCMSLALQTGAVVAAVDYRLAPEHAYPVPLEDCFAAWRYLQIEADSLRIDTARMAIVGVSAGGGLAAGLSLLIRDRAAGPIAGQVLFYPMLDDRNIAQADDDHPDTLVWSRASNLFGWEAYLGGPAGGADTPIYAAPARAAAQAENVSGLPPTYLPVGELDLFRDENIAFARALMAAGVPTELHVFPGACHSFDSFVPASPLSITCRREVTAFLLKVLA